MILFKIPIVISPKNRDLHLSECHGFGKPFALFIYVKKFDEWTIDIYLQPAAEGVPCDDVAWVLWGRTDSCFF